ncbi:M81 family metallopeptidase [Phaeobacter sp. 11ANDIMAR09]|uniref:M81 family metallopeptidase n=1 Tax=Phaeobacter sp. 11ANDIMAR09 TaxID=1225647 RepID=UPI0006C8B71A|nr:M81 family metallopeptidase [Phaeobacter sp. 11ANDIMAR09]KPD10415.1 MlrC [Phaeobacter sp. 11ANDIMAR09]
MTIPRVAIAGFQHETNCFGVTKAGLAEFEMADSWPAMLHGTQVIEEIRGMNLPIAGFAAAALAAGIDVVPVLWCAAEPSAEVTDHAFEAICSMILAGIAKAGPLDAVYLDLHGAMVTESLADGEGEILRRVRKLIGPDIPLVASLDLHANVSQAMVDLADYLAIFRTYPHLDMAETGARCLSVLQRLLNGHALHKVFHQVPYLIPLHAQFTGVPPFDALYGSLPTLAEQGVWAEVALGFTAADFPDTGPSCVTYAVEPDAATKVADDLLARFLRLEGELDHSMLTLEEAVFAAQQSYSHPLVLADVQDNPGAGGTSDTTGVLEALLKGGGTNVLMGLFHDPALAAKAHIKGVNSHFQSELGGKSGLPGQSPLKGEFEVLALSDGHCRYSGEMYYGGIATMGPSAALKLRLEKGEVDLVVTSIRNQCLDLAQFTHFGLNPLEYNTVCVKSTVHFRAAFSPIASRIFAVSSPGVFLCDLTQVPYQQVQEKRRI